jgi:putative FmdB family regulatory protein
MPGFTDRWSVPSYEFKCKCGHTEARIRRITQAPPLGSVVKCPACLRRTLRRICSVVTVAFAAMKASNKYPYISRQHSAERLGTKATEHGHAIIESRAHERDVMSRTGLVRD